MQLTHLACSLNCPCAFSMASYQTKKSLQITSEYLPLPWICFNLMWRLGEIQQTMFSTVVSFFVFFFFLKFLGSTVVCPGQKWIWEELRIEEFFKPLSNHSSSHQKWHRVPLAHILLTFWVFPVIINHIPIASFSALPPPIYFYYYDFLPPSLLKAEVFWAHTMCQTHFKNITHVNLFGPLSGPQPFWHQGTGSVEDNFSTDGESGGRDGFWMIQAHYIYYALNFYYYYISSTSDHQALDPRGWRPLHTTQFSYYSIL